MVGGGTSFKVADAFGSERSDLFQAGANFVVNGAALSHDAMLASVSVELAWFNGMSVAAAFDGEFSGTTASYAGKGVLQYRW